MPNWIFQKISGDQQGVRPGICVKYFLSFPQKKNLPPEEAERKQVFFSFSDSNKQTKNKNKRVSKSFKANEWKKGQFI